MPRLVRQVLQGALLSSFVLLASVPASAAPADAPVASAPAASFDKQATDWLALVDGKDYAASHKAAGSGLRGQVTEAQWAAAMMQVRAPLGEVSQRRHVGTQAQVDPPGAPKGEYQILRFETQFAKAKATETVALVKDTDGQWRVTGYFIR